MNDSEKCFNCKHLKFREGYIYPYRCDKHKEYSCKESEIKDYFQTTCKHYSERKTDVDE